MTNNELQFVQRPNPVTGKLEWSVCDKDDLDYFADIARSSYADMLHDDERNKRYHSAIVMAVKEMHSRGKKAKVLDIGTGSGLLSMMAASAGADVITAIEVFSPMANIARQIVSTNGFDFIKVINKHSTDVSIGTDMKEKANILVTELFDTELIGEGALNAYHHAHTNLMEEECIAVPHKAMTYVQVVESPSMLSWNELLRQSFYCKGELIKVEPDSKIVGSSGLPSVHDIQLSQFPVKELKFLTNPIQVFEFDWSSKHLSTEPRSSTQYVTATNSGQTQAVLSWWDLEMYKGDSNILSTAPVWCHPTPNSMQWRDHWMQSVYFIPSKVDINKSETLVIKSYHDDYSMWFETTKDVESDEGSAAIIRPFCDYPPRALWSRPRLGMINDSTRNETITLALQKLVPDLGDGVAICSSDFSLVSLLLAQCDFKDNIIALENNKLAQRGLVNLIKHNNLENKIDVLLQNDNETPLCKIQSLNRNIALLVGEPFFTSSILPWHDLHFWYIRSELQSLFTSNTKVMPYEATLWIAGVEFDDLWKIRSPVGTVEGFNISDMDSMIDKALEVKEYHEPEPHALWEYKNRLSTIPTAVMTFNFQECIPEQNLDAVGTVKIDGIGTHCHGVAMWMEYKLHEDLTLSTGIDTRTIVNNEKDSFLANPSWSRHYKQGVFLFKSPHCVDRSKPEFIDYKVTFQPELGEIKCSFNVT